MIEFRNNLDPQFKLIVIWILSGLVSAYYTSNRNWKQQKYFKLQQIWEEIIYAIWKWQTAYVLHDIEKENLSFQSELLFKTIKSGHTDKEMWKKRDNDYNEILEKLEKFWEMKTMFYHTIFSKIQVYFSEPWLSKARDQSIVLSKLIAELSLEKNKNRKEEIEKKMISVCNKLKNTIIIKTIRYGRPFYKNIRYYLTNKYENQ